MIPKLAIAAILISAFAAPAWAMDCGSPPPVADVALRGDIGVEANIISKKLGTVSGNVAASYTRNEVYSRYPHADKAAADRYFQYEICETVSADPKLTTMQRLKIIRDARAQFSAGGPPRGTTLTKKGQNSSSRPRPETPGHPSQSLPVVNENHGTFAGNQYNAQNMSFNATPEQKKYLPGLQDIYARGSTIYSHIRNTAPTNEIVDQEISDANKWLNDSQLWLQTHMTQAAADNLNNVKVGGLIYGGGTSLDSNHQQLFSHLMIQMPQYLDNVRYLMYSNTFDPQ